MGENIVVRVLDEEWKLEDFDISCIPEYLFNVEAFGALDPLGQLISWLWDQIDSALDTLETSVKNYMDTIKEDILDPINKVKDIVDTVKSNVGSIIDLFGDFPEDLPDLASYLGKLKDLASNILNLFGTFPTEFPDLASYLGAIYEYAKKAAEVPVIVGKEVAKGMIEYIVTDILGIQITLPDGGQGNQGVTTIGDIIGLFVHPDILKAIWDTVYGWLSQILPDGMKSILDTFINAWSTLLQTIQQTILSFFEPLLKPAQLIIEKLVAKPFPPTVAEVSNVLNWIVWDLGGKLALWRILVGGILTLLQTEVEVMGTKVKIHARDLAEGILDVIDPRVFIASFGLPLLTNIVTMRFQTQLKYELLERYTPEIPSVDDAQDFLVKGFVSETVFDSILKKRGLGDAYRALYKYQSLKVFTDTDLTFLLSLISKATPDGQIQIPEALKPVFLEFIKSQGYRYELAPEGIKGVYETFVKSKLYALAIPPSIQDLITFSVREVYEYLAKQYEKVKASAPSAYLKFAQMKGLGEYWALSYWEAHWRLIPPEHVANLYFRGEISTKNFLDYLRYHDYRPIARPNFPQPDTELMRRALFEIPLRIDARWMARWGLVSIKDMARIVIMRRMHPEWLTKVITAEWVNAIYDERSRLVSSLMRNVGEGLITPEDFKNFVSAYTLKGVPQKIEVIGAGGEKTTLTLPTKIWLLNPDEIELSLKKVALDIQRTYVKNKITELENRFIAGELTVKELADELQKLIPVTEVRNSVFTRILARKVRDGIYYVHRQLLRNVDAICSLYEEEFITREQAIAEIKRIAGRYLTDAQIQLIIRESDDRKRKNLNKYYYKAIINRVKRGLLRPYDARRELMKLGLSEKLAEAIIEAEAKTHVLSVDKLVSMMEYVPISPRYFLEKCDAMGVPPDEVVLYVPYAIAREFKDELEAYRKEVEKDYVEGEIREDEYKRELDNIATLWGQAPKWLGVPWILYSPDERKLLLAIAKKKRQRYLRKQAKKKK